MNFATIEAFKTADLFSVLSEEEKRITEVKEFY